MFRFFPLTIRIPWIGKGGVRSKVKPNKNVGTNCLTVRNLLEANDLNKVKDKARFLSSRKKHILFASNILYSFLIVKRWIWNGIDLEMERKKKKKIDKRFISKTGKEILTDLDFFFSLCFHLIGIYYLIKDF